MSFPKTLPVLLLAALSVTGVTTDAAAQARGGGHAGGGGRAVATGGGHTAVAAPRPPAPGTVGTAVPRPPFYGGRYPYYPCCGFYRPWYPYYGWGWPSAWWGYRGWGWGYPGFSLSVGFGFGFPSSYAYFPYAYGAYVYPGGGGTSYPEGSVSASGGVAYGGVRIVGAPRDAQVYLDGYYSGVVDDFDGSSQHMTISAGVHKIEIRVSGQEPIEFDVNVQPGQTITYRVGAR